MASDLNTCLRQLKTCLDTKQIPHARSIIDRITQLIIEKVDESEAETDYNLECVITSANGLVAFLNKSFSNAKHFVKVIESTFELFRKTIEKHSPLMGKRMVVIVPLALRYIQSSSVPARSRELAALVLQDCIAYGCLQNETYDQLDQLPAELLLVFRQGKLPNRFQQNLYEVLGQIAKHFPACIHEPDRIRDIFLNAAEKQLLEENYPSLVSLAGAVRGLDLFLAHFAPSESDRALRERLYVLMKKLSIWEESRSERAVFRNALQLISNHAPLFTLHLYVDHVHWQTMLAGKWINSSNQDDKDVGLKALYAFHGEIARILSDPELTAESERECPSKVDVLNQYVAYYRKLLNSATADRLEIRIAIRGFGIMAGPCQQIAGSRVSLNELLTIVLQRIEGICERSASSTGEMLVYLPDFIQALSEILTHAKQLTAVQLVSVQTMTVALVRDFYHIPTVQHELIVRSLVSMLENIGKLGGSTRDQLLDSVLLQGIVWSCTHALPFSSAPTVQSPNADPAHKLDWKRDLVTYKNYLPLWQGLLEKAQSAQDASMLRAIYRAFMNTLFVIVEKLDLSTRKRTFQDDDGNQRELFFCDPNIDLLPTKPKDYHIFLNLVELYRDVLHGSQTSTAVRELFTDWIRPYFDRFVRQSLNRPLVSGFVKLIEMGLVTVEKIGYFRQKETPSQTDDLDVRSTQMLLAYYLEQTIQRALNAIGELQLACLRFVFNAPIRLLVDFIEDEDRKQPLMMDVYRTAFHLGRGLLSIARTALYSLQRIIRFRYPPLGPKLRERLLRQVLPLLEPFLRTRDSTQPPAQSLRLAKFKRHRTANVAAVKIERIKQQHRIEQSVDTSELVTFQMRILNFFADLQPNECCWLVVDELEQQGVHGRENRGLNDSLTRWDADSGRSLELRLLCESGTRPCIKLDSIVGRVCELAVECSDRATKLAACELLHTIILYLLGINYQDQLTGLWSQLCHHLLQLSCDTDLAVCQMFEPLLFQIIHFVTQPSKLNQQGTRALLDCLMDATSNVRHSAIRDLSVRCLREFLQWTNRQCGGTQLANDRRKIKCTLLEQLKTHAMESNAAHRYGSALVFNNLFRLLLQDDFHIVRYSFELMHSYAIGLIVTEQEQIGLSGAASGGSGGGAIAEQYLLALDHLGKLLEQRKAMFNGRGNESNRTGQRQLIPAEIGGGEMEHLVRWLFRQCAARQRLYRRKCMELFVRLSKKVHEVASGEQFLAAQFTQQQIESICLQADSLQGIDRAVTLESLRDERTNPLIMNVYLWLEYFLATIDVYCWLRREKLIKEGQLQATLRRILPAVRYFLQSVVHFTVYEILSNIEASDGKAFQLPCYEQRTNTEKIVRFDALKSAVVIQVVELLVLLLTSSLEESCSEVCLEVWQDQPTIEFLLSLLFKSHQLGLDCTAPGQHELGDDRQLWKQLETLLLQLIERCNEPIGQHFATALSEKLLTVMEDLSARIKTLLIQRTIQVVDQKLAKGLCFIAKRLQNRTLLVQASKERVQHAARKLLQDCYEAIGQEHVCLVLSQSAARFGAIVLEAIFALADVTHSDGLVQPVISCCLSEDMLHPNIRHGEHFLACFGPAVYELFLLNPTHCLGALFEALKSDNFTFIVRFLCNLMDYCYQRKQAANTARFKSLVDVLLADGWSQLFNSSRLQSNPFGACDVQLIELMSHVAMICPFPLNEIHQKVGPAYGRWLTELIGSKRPELSIELKAKAIVLLPSLVGPDGTPQTESHWAEVDNALEALQTSHFPVRSTEFPPNSPDRIGYLNCLERLLDVMVISRSPLLLKAILQMTAPDGEGHIAESQLRTAVERFFAYQSHESQCNRLEELWELFANHTYAPTVRETILRRYLCTALWHCRYDSIVQFYKRIIRSISNFTTVEINGCTGWELEHALVDRAASFRLIEQYAALLPKAILKGDNCPVAQQLYCTSAHDTGGPVRGQRLIGDFSKRAHSVRRVVFATNDRTVAELFRKYQCAAYRALVALISNTNEDARMYSVLLFRESRDKGEFLWRHFIDCSNDELYLEGSQEQDQLSRTFEKRVAIRREERTGHPTRLHSLKDPGLSVVMESSLSQQVMFRFDMSHSVVLSAREVAQKDAAELVKRQKGTLSNVALERSKINQHEIMATVCGCIRHMAATKVALDSVVQFLAISLTDSGQPKNVRLFLAKVIDNCRQELQPHASLLLGPLMQLIVDGYIFCGLNPLVTDLIALVLEWNASCESRRIQREGAIDEIASLASVLLRFVMKHACQQSRKMAVLRLNLELVQELIEQWHEVLIVPAELLFEMVSPRQTGAGPTDEGTQLQLIAGLQLGTIVLLYGRGKLVPWMDSTKQAYLRAVLRCLDLPDSSSFKSAALLLGHSLARLYPAGFPEEEQQQQEGDVASHTECLAKLTSIQREYERKFVEILYEVAKGFPSIADPYLSVLSYRFPGASSAEKRMYLVLLLGGRLEKFHDELYRELASMELTLLLRDSDLQLPTLHLLNRSFPLVRELEHLEQLVEPIGRVTVETSTPTEARAVAYEILIYIHGQRFAELSVQCQTSVWRYLIRGLCGSQETDIASIRGRILEYLTDSGTLPGDVKERFQFVLAQLYDPTVESEFLGSAVGLLLDPAIRCRESKDRLFLHEYLNADVKFCEYSIETAARQRHTMTLLTPMFAETAQQRQLQSSITGSGSQMEQLIRATQLGGFNNTVQQAGTAAPFEPTQDPSKLIKGNETFAMPTQHTLMFETSALQLNRRSQRTDNASETGSLQNRSFERLRKRILKDSAANRHQQTAWAVSRHYSSKRNRTEQRRESASKVTLYRRYRLADYPDLQINLLAFLLPLQALCRRDTACARQTFVAIFNGLLECLLAGDTEANTVRMVGEEWDRFVARLDGSLNRILESTKACEPNLFGGLIELTLGKASGKFTFPPRTITTVAGTSNMLPVGALYLEAKLTDGEDFDEEPVRTVGNISSEAEHWLQLSTLYHTLHEHSIMVGIFAEKLDSDPQLREAIELEALGRYDQAHRTYCELIMRLSQARVEERNFCYKSAFNCLLRLGQWDVLLNEIGNQVTNHEDLWNDEWNQENLLPNYVHGNALRVLAGDAAGREFYHMLQQWLHIPEREQHIRQEFGEELTALYISGQDMVRGRLFGEQTKRQFLDEWHCAGVLSELVRTECLLNVRKVIELVAYGELLERSTNELEQATDGLLVSWKNAQPTVTDSLLVWDTLISYRRFLLEQLESKCTAQQESVCLTNVSQLSTQLFELELNLLDVAFQQNNIKYAGKIIARLRAFEACLREPQIDQVVRRKIARIRYDRMRLVEVSPSANATPALLRGLKQLVKLNAQLVSLEEDAGVREVKQNAWTEIFHHSETVRTVAKASNGNIQQEDTSILVQLMQTTMNITDECMAEELPGMSERLRHFSIHCLQRGIDILLNGPSSSRERGANGSAMEKLAEAHLRLARYCYDELNPERSETEELPVERLLLTSLLPAIKHGSREARHLFPVLLQLRNIQNNTLRNEFLEHSCAVPSWNFLPWIPQLLSYMKITYDVPQTSNEEHFLDDLFMRLVKQYPMALYFPARLILDEHHADVPVRPFVNHFRAALSFPVLERFVEELCRVVIPETRIANMLAELKNNLNGLTEPSSYQTFIDRVVVPDAFPPDTTEMWQYGQAYRAALPLVDRFRSLKLLHPVDDRGAILEKLQELEKNLQLMRTGTKTTRLQLEELSPWLADYHSSGQRDISTSIEIPGQYGLDRSGPPAPAHHVTIVKVVPDVVVYGTLRMPIQLTVRGSDGHEYRFLAKFGEDLRQDQRIQQLQREITHRLQWDRRCREQQLQLRTYEVVPIRPNFGLFGWLEGTVALSDISKQAGPRYNPGDRGQAAVHEEYGRFLMSVAQQDPTAPDVFHGSTHNGPALYGMAAAFCMPDQLESKFVELAQTIRSNTLKRALYDMSATPEAFYRLRMNFAKSLATMNITCWVLGIGDRHLSNIVLERATGMLVGVDFGIAFGAGTRDLPIPELVPFRLTPQIVGVMEPMRLAGVLQKCHLYTLQCLRDARMLLRACLEVFVREPTVDWLRAARKRTAEIPESKRSAPGREWNPRDRVDTVLRKLGGANPKKLLANELQFGVVAQQREFLVGYLALVDAAAPVSTGKLRHSGPLSTELQTEMLLEMAIDCKLLGITYSGWYPWF